MTKMTGSKFDQGKPRMELLPTHGIVEVAKVMTKGAEKYGDFNYLGGLEHGRLAGAALRHIFAYLNGNDLDELGTLHLANAATDLLMIIELSKRGLGKDNRFVSEDVAAMSIADTPNINVPDGITDLKSLDGPGHKLSPTLQEQIAAMRSSEEGHDRGKILRAIEELKSMLRYMAHKR
jgi:hypothetical protein